MQKIETPMVQTAVRMTEETRNLLKVITKHHSKRTKGKRSYSMYTVALVLGTQLLKAQMDKDLAQEEREKIDNNVAKTVGI